MEHRRYHEDARWTGVSSIHLALSRRVGTPALLSSLASEKVASSPFEPEDTSALKKEVITKLESSGLCMKREWEDRDDVPFDYRHLDLLNRASGDPEI